MLSLQKHDKTQFIDNTEIIGSAAANLFSYVCCRT